MRTLNDPLDYDEHPTGLEWTPWKGVRRGARYGLVAAVILIALLAPLAVYLPYMLIILWLRVPLTFGLAWLLFKAVERGAGMIGWPCVIMTLGLTTLVLVSHHVVFAVCGAPEPCGVDPWWIPPSGILERYVSARHGLLIGWTWLHPNVLLAENLLPLLCGGGFAIATCNR